MSNDFSNKEIPHYPGYLVGIRAMEVHRTGKIHSPSQYYVWAPGTNQAAYFKRCKQLYPDIPWYDTVEAAIKDFPLSGKVH